MIQRGSESGNVRDRPPSRGSLCVVGWLLLGRRSHRTESSLRCGFASSCVTRAARVLRERARERERTEARVPNHEPPKPVSHGARTTNRRGTCRSRGREGAFPVQRRARREFIVHDRHAQPAEPPEFYRRRHHHTCPSLLSLRPASHYTLRWSRTWEVDTRTRTFNTPLTESVGLFSRGRSGNEMS